MRSVALMLSILFGLTACGQRKVEAERVASPDRLVIAVYEKYYFGGAAGGTGHCISIIRNESDERSCELLGSRVCITSLGWEDDVLLVKYHDGEFVRKADTVSVPRHDGGSNQYHFRLIVDEGGEDCLSEWD